MDPRTGIQPAELADRRGRLLERAVELRLGGVVLFDEHYIRYFTGLGFLATERPVGVLLGLDGARTAFVPEFEVERVRAEADFERIESYPEYPGLEHPLRVLARILADVGISDPVGADQDGYPGILGYQGPALSEVTGNAVAPLGGFIEGMLVHKSEAEVGLIRESAKWCGVGHRRLQEHIWPGATETEASLRAGQAATLELLAALGSSYGGQQASSDGVSAGFRGQIGRRSSWAHAVAHNIEFREGDVLVTETSAPIWGYNAELERALVVGTPTAEMRRLFDHMVAAQEVALEALRPGITCADVDLAVLRYFDEHHIRQYWRQHTGHAIGLRNHEAPFLDVGDRTPIEPGMVFTVEPGVYSSDVGGFRHSDTVVVTADGIDVLTDYPRDLDSLTIDAA
jgi:Xaa-Pro dipeptidase